MPESAVEEKIEIFIADSVELLGNVLVIKIGENIHAVSVDKVKFKGRGKRTGEKDYAYTEEQEPKTNAEKAVIEESLENYFNAGYYYKDAGNQEKAKEMFLLSAEENLNDPDPNRSKRSKYEAAAHNYEDAGEFNKAIEMYSKVIEDAKKNNVGTV